MNKNVVVEETVAEIAPSNIAVCTNSWSAHVGCSGYGSLTSFYNYLDQTIIDARSEWTGYVDGELTTFGASVQASFTAWSDEWGSYADFKKYLESYADQVGIDLSSSISETYATQTDLNSTTATAETALASTITNGSDISANLNLLYQTEATLETAIAVARTSLEASIDDVEVTLEQQAYVVNSSHNDFVDAASIEALEVLSAGWEADSTYTDYLGVIGRITDGDSPKDFWQYLGPNYGWRKTSTAQGFTAFGSDRSIYTDANGNITGWTYIGADGLGEDQVNEFGIHADYFYIQNSSTSARPFEIDGSTITLAGNVSIGGTPQTKLSVFHGSVGTGGDFSDLTDLCASVSPTNGDSVLHLTGVSGLDANTMYYFTGSSCSSSESWTTSKGADGSPAYTPVSKGTEGAITLKKDQTYSPSTFDMEYSYFDENGVKQYKPAYFEVKYDSSSSVFWSGNASGIVTSPNLNTSLVLLGTPVAQQKLTVYWYDNSTDMNLLDKEVIPIISEAKDSVVMNLTNDNVTLQAPATGTTGIDYSLASTNVEVYVGGSRKTLKEITWFTTPSYIDIDDTWVLYPVDTASEVEAGAAFIQQLNYSANLTISHTTDSVSVTAIDDSISDTGYIKIGTLYCPSDNSADLVYLTQTFTITLARQGDQGYTGASVDIIFTRSSSSSVVSAPAASADVPDGWCTNPPSNGSTCGGGNVYGIVWASQGVKEVNSDVFVWGTPYRVEGTAIAEVKVYSGLYNVGSTAPTKPADVALSYNFASQTVNVGSSGWLTTPPTVTNGKVCYVSTAAVGGSVEQTGVPISGWSNPVPYITRVDGKKGDDGDRSPVRLYRDILNTNWSSTLNDPTGQTIQYSRVTGTSTWFSFNNSLQSFVNSQVPDGDPITGDVIYLQLYNATNGDVFYSCEAHCTNGSTDNWAYNVKLYVDGDALIEGSVWVGGSVQSKNFNIDTGVGFRLNSEGNTAGDPTIYGAYIQGGTIASPLLLTPQIYVESENSTYGYAISSTVIPLQVDTNSYFDYAVNVRFTGLKTWKTTQTYLHMKKRYPTRDTLVFFNPSAYIARFYFTSISTLTIGMQYCTYGNDSNYFGSSYTLTSGMNTVGGFIVNVVSDSSNANIKYIYLIGQYATMGSTTPSYSQYEADFCLRFFMYDNTFGSPHTRTVAADGIHRVLLNNQDL